MSSCPVCLENIEEVGYIVFNCGHKMHSDCFQIYLNTSLNSCPLCRSKDIPHVNDNLKKEIKSLEKERDNLRYVLHETNNELQETNLFNEDLIKENQTICTRYNVIKKRYNQLTKDHNALQEQMNQDIDKRKANAFEKICDSNKITKRRKDIYLNLLEEGDSMTLKGLFRKLRSKFSSTTLRKDLKEMEHANIIHNARGHAHLYTAR